MTEHTPLRRSDRIRALHKDTDAKEAIQRTQRRRSAVPAPAAVTATAPAIPDSRMIIAGVNHHEKLWVISAQTGRLVTMIDTNPNKAPYVEPCCLALSNDGTNALIGYSGAEYLALYHIPSGKKVGTIYLAWKCNDKEKNVRGIVYSPSDDRILVCTSSYVSMIYPHDSFRTWYYSCCGDNEYDQSVAKFIPGKSSDMFVTLSKEGKLTVHDRKNPLASTGFDQIDSKFPTDFCISGDGKQIFIVTINRELEVREFEKDYKKTRWLCTASLTDIMSTIPLNIYVANARSELMITDGYGSVFKFLFQGLRLKMALERSARPSNVLCARDVDDPLMVFVRNGFEISAQTKSTFSDVMKITDVRAREYTFVMNAVAVSPCIERKKE